MPLRSRSGLWNRTNLILLETHVFALLLVAGLYAWASTRTSTVSFEPNIFRSAVCLAIYLLARVSESTVLIVQGLNKMVDRDPSAHRRGTGIRCHEHQFGPLGMVLQRNRTRPCRIYPLGCHDGVDARSTPLPHPSHCARRGYVRFIHHDTGLSHD